MSSDKPSQITITFREDHPELADIKFQNVNHWQIFSAAKMLEIHGEGFYMQNQIQQSQREQLTKRIVTPQKGVS